MDPQTPDHDPGKLRVTIRKDPGSRSGKIPGHDPDESRIASKLKEGVPEYDPGKPRITIRKDRPERSRIVIRNPPGS